MKLLPVYQNDPRSIWSIHRFIYGSDVYVTPYPGDSPMFHSTVTPEELISKIELNRCIRVLPS